MKRTILAAAAAMLAAGCGGGEEDPCGVVSRGDRHVFVCPGMEEAECRPEAAGDNLLPDVFYADGFTCFGRLPRPVYQ